MYVSLWIYPQWSVGDTEITLFFSLLPFPPPSLLSSFLILFAKLLPFFKVFFLCVLESFACIYIRVPCAYNFCGGQKRTSHPLELE